MRAAIMMIALWMALHAGMAPAAQLSERSPVRLGLWWDPARSGSGFEFFDAGDQIVLVWYTYRVDGSPIWYSAAGAFDSEGQFDAKPRFIFGQWKMMQTGKPFTSARNALYTPDLI
jgi:hypothetical protein